ncbi:MAG: hypothetical protein ACLQGP_20520 [Isosphaeraceae bacterium]
MFLLLLSIAWVPAVCLLLDPKPAGWLFVLMTSSMAFSPCLTSLWLTFAFAIGFVATKALHQPDRRRGPDLRP